MKNLRRSTWIKDEFLRVITVSSIFGNFQNSVNKATKPNRKTNKKTASQECNETEEIEESMLFKTTEKNLQETEDFDMDKKV